MPEYPYVYTDVATRRVEPGGTRVRVFRRRPRPDEDRSEQPEAEAGETAWRTLLEGAVADLNAGFQHAKAPWQCHLEEDDAGFLLRVVRGGGGATPAGEEELDEVLEPADLPAWLARLRTRLGLLVDERV